MTREAWDAHNETALAARYRCEFTPAGSARLLGDWVCRVRPGKSETVADRPAIAATLYWYGNDLASVRVRFGATDYEDIRDALIARWGPPTERAHESVSTALGAKFENETITWRTGGDTITVQRYSGKVSEGSLTLDSNTAIQEFARRRGIASQAGQSDL